MLADDALAMVTGFASVLVRAGSASSRGLWTDVEDVEPRTGMLIRRRALLVAAAALPALDVEDTITVGALEDDATTTSYRVVDVRRESEGLLWRILVAAA